MDCPARTSPGDRVSEKDEMRAFRSGTLMMRMDRARGKGQRRCFTSMGKAPQCGWVRSTVCCEKFLRC